MKHGCRSHFPMHFGMSIHDSKAKDFNSLTDFCGNDSVVSDIENMRKQALKIL